MLRNSLFLCGLFFVLEEVTSLHRFGYAEAHQRRWARHHGHCAGKTQSPINVHSSKAIALHMPGIDMIGYHNLLPHPLKMRNNGHTVSISIPKLSEDELNNGEFLPTVRGGRLPGEFAVEGIHFHWGDKNNRGAEHVINDIRYPMEMHIVHRNQKYDTFHEALEFLDGVAVLGFFFNVIDEEDPALITISRHLHLIPHADEEISLNVTFSLWSLINSVDTDKFYMYKGSLTTPPCSEAVTWVLFPHPISISPKQLSQFRQLQDDQEDALVDNFRVLQPIGSRRIFLRHTNTRHTNTANLQNDLDYRLLNWFH